LSELKPGKAVYMQPEPGLKQWKPATVVTKSDTPRSYVRETGTQKYRRNRRALRKFHSTTLQSQPREEPVVDMPLEEYPPGQVPELPPRDGEVPGLPPKDIPMEAAEGPPDPVTQSYTTRRGRTVRVPQKLNL